MKISSFMILGLCLSFKVNAATPESCFDFDTVAGTINGYTCPDTDVVIPNLIKGVQVKRIGNNSFSEKAIISLKLPEGLISIGVYAFYKTTLSSITIPDSVVTIEDGAFYRSKQLSKVKLSSALVYIGSLAFSEDAITDLVLPSNVIYIGDLAFQGGELRTLQFPHEDYALNIGDFAFQNNHLVEVTLPASMMSVGRGAFKDNHLKSIAVPTLQKIKEYAFASNELETVIFPSGTWGYTVENESFTDNNLTAVKIPKIGPNVSPGAFDEDVKVERY